MPRQSTKRDTPLTNLKKARDDLTIKDVVLMVGTTVGHIFRIENGRVVPRRELAAKLATLFSQDAHERHLFCPERYFTSREPSVDAMA